MNLCLRKVWSIIPYRQASWREIVRKTPVAITKHVNARILLLRGHKVILDSDLAELYGVEVKHLNQQIKRNRKRFPEDFVFRVAQRELEILRSQIVTSSERHGGRRYLPLVFTEHGAIMAATVLKSKRAIQMSIFVVRAFVRMREALAANHQITVKLAELERRLGNHDVRIQDIVQAIRQLMAPPAANRRRIGFEVPPGAGKAAGGRVLALAARA
jgi:phage regulator Rha-like protein